MPASGGQLPDTDPRRYNRGIVVKVETHHCRVVPRVKPEYLPNTRTNHNDLLNH